MESDDYKNLRKGTKLDEQQALVQTVSFMKSLLQQIAQQMQQDGGNNGQQMLE